MSTVTALPQHDDTRSVIAAEIRSLMGRHAKTQGDLAVALGISQSQMSKRLRGVIPLDSDELTSIATYFGVSVGSLFGESTTRLPEGPHDDGTSLPSEAHRVTQEYARQLSLVAA